MGSPGNEVPQLAEMALPFQGPNTLPPGIDLPTAMIAHHDPKELEQAVQDARNTYAQCYFDRRDDEIDTRWGQYERTNQRSGAWKAEDESTLKDIADSLVAEVLEQAEIEVKEARLRETAALAYDIAQGSVRLSRPKRRLVAALSAVLGAGFSLGILGLAAAADDPSPESGMLPSQRIEQEDDTFDPDLTMQLVVGGVSGIVGGGIGYAFGDSRQAQYAQARAARRVRKAVRRQNAAK